MPGYSISGVGLGAYHESGTCEREPLGHGLAVSYTRYPSSTLFPFF